MQNTLDKRLLHKICKEHLKLNKEKKKTIEKWVKTLIIHLHQKYAGEGELGGSVVGLSLAQVMILGS